MRLLLTSGLLFISLAVFAEVKEDNLHVRTWNQFAQDILKFHQSRIKDMDVVVKEDIGGYSHLSDFYIEKKYFSDNKHIATIMWEKENPELLHSIEVLVRDSRGRIIRDYVAAYLPSYRNAPTQTLISLHNYHKQLHAFRTFDASGYRIIERCTGLYKGKEINFLLDEDEIAEALEDSHTGKGPMMSAHYKACFGELQQDVGIYLRPH